MKRKIPVTAFFIALASVVMFFLLFENIFPQPILKDDQDVLITDVSYFHEKVSVNSEQIVSILKKYSSIKTLKSYMPYSKDDVIIDINMVVDNKPVHVVLGNFYIWYESGDKFAFDIINGEELQSEITALLR